MIQGPPLPEMKYSTVHEMLAAAARTDCGLIFVDVQEEETWLSYREIHQRARRMAHILIQLGIRPGDRVAIGIPTSPSFMDAFFGTLLAGAVPAPLYPAPRLGRLDDYHSNVTRMLQSVGVRLLLADAHTVTVLKTVAEAAQLELGCRMVEELFPDTAREEAEVQVSPEALGLIQFSSGSTSTPKGVAVTHLSLMVHTAMQDKVLMAERGPNEMGANWLPLYHDMGLIGCLLVPMRMQISTVLMSPETFIAQPRLWLRAISRHGGTIIVAPNFAYELCLRRVPEAELDTLRLHTLRIAMCGAEPVSASLMEAFSKRFERCGLKQQGILRPVYGLAEATLAVTHPNRKHAPIRWLGVDPTTLAQDGRAVEGQRKIVSVGAPMPGVDVQIRDESGHELPERRVGRIFVRTPSPARGYFNNPEATAQAFFGEWLYTGDLGFIEDGELFICGRVKELVIIRGANHSPELFEDCLEDVDGLRPGRVVAAGFIPAGGETEELLILAERSALTRESNEAIERKIRKAILDHTGLRAHTILLLPKGTIRRTSSGKLRRQDALQRFLAGEFTPREPLKRASGSA
jgi:fatty-acyl-CoA synthase